MHIPDWFQDRLHAESGGRLRIRWSQKRGEFHIEQKVGRAALPPFRIDPYDDSLIRARDGYWFVMAIRPGDRMPCPHCGLTVKVPVMEFRETRCEYCRYKGRDGRYKAAYFPLSESLLEHLRKIDPERGGIDRLIAETDRANEQREAARLRAASNDLEAIGKDSFTKIFDIQSVGYTGKERMWDR